jgi:DNA invertase Pin-like site-specific DNA recombinase
MMTRRCAIYMRHSSLLPRDHSIEDQERRCRERAEMERWPVVEEYTETEDSRAKSGRRRTKGSKR